MSGNERLKFLRFLRFLSPNISRSFKCLFGFSFLARICCLVYSRLFETYFMNYTKLQWWDRFQKYYTEFPELGLAVDLSRMNVDDAFFARMEPKIQKAFADMAKLESRSEERRVGKECRSRRWP